MSDSAKITSEAHQAYQTPYQHTDVIEVEGIELFESISHSSESLPSLPNDLTKVTKGLPIREAARVLGISVNSVRAKLKSGELSGCKVKGPTGEQWRVELTKVTSKLGELGNEPVKIPESATNAEMQKLLDIIEKQNARLEAASGQIGYLQAQLENSRDSIKLLEDRSKRPWWRRFWEALKS